ncbi:glycosyltransferase [Pseudogracilibacillus auburnensis]|uniref:Glycosyltransferase involved in cell wall biosynthesis n=1 Tax=Pseudogracilibacillus auburnensis TaxID=1494959 RepID=A0A2V3WPI4_9BACI|nr:glycosyltransferase family 2 protein [Pseudogracilibacillus auburnensis]PXW90629.1 glycosyltransferase involved in cell wall biosynthesis [Pseudogracilibacillus auburnensis]
MITISLCMIVKNEEEVLAGCLNSVKEYCDEIIIVDTGSTDETKKIASKFTKKIYDFKWIDDFSAARNFAFSKARMDFIFWLDADDILLENDQKKLRNLKKSLNTDIDAVSMNYILQFDEYGKPSFYFRRHRLVKRINNFQWKGQVHEYLEVGGNILQADIAVTHRKNKKNKDQQSSDRNIKIYEKRLEKNEKFSPRDLYYYANELKDHRQYNKAIQYYQKFINCDQGWYEDKIRACLYMSDIYRVKKEHENECKLLLQTFKYDKPRPETCCKLGDYFLRKKLYYPAIYWFETAVRTKYKNPQGFHHEAFSTWYPHLSLCFSYWRIGNKEKSIYHHEIVKNIRPNDPKVLYNEQFFNGTAKK